MLSSTVSTASAGSIILSSTSTSSLTYASALKSQSGLTILTAQSLPLVSRTSSLIPPVVSCFLPKPYLTIYDLYMRFAPLSSLTKSTMSSAVSLPVSLLRVLPPMILKDLFNRFAPKASATPLNSPLAANPPAPPAL